MAEYGSDLIVDMLKSLGIKYAGAEPGGELSRHPRLHGEL